MTKDRVLGSAQAVKALAERLAQCPQVTKWDHGEDVEAWTLAHAFADLEKSFTTFLHTHLSALMRKGLTPSQTHDVLLDIGEEFRHILYHMRDPKFYRYISEDDDEALESRPPSRS